MYTVNLTKKAAKNYDKLPEKLKNEIRDALNELQYSFAPNRLDIKKLKGCKSTYRVRVGHWRIIYEIDIKEKSILIYGILPRKNAYG